MTASSQFQQSLVGTNQRRKSTTTRKGSKEVNEALHFLSSLQHYCQSQINKCLAVALKSANLTLCWHILYLHLNRSKSTKFLKKGNKNLMSPHAPVPQENPGQDQIKFHLKKWQKRAQGGWFLRDKSMPMRETAKECCTKTNSPPHEGLNLIWSTKMRLKY